MLKTASMPVARLRGELIYGQVSLRDTCTQFSTGSTAVTRVLNFRLVQSSFKKLTISCTQHVYELLMCARGICAVPGYQVAVFCPDRLGGTFSSQNLRIPPNNSRKQAKQKVARCAPSPSAPFIPPKPRSLDKTLLSGFVVG
jgi:hypothetical protein